MKAIKIRYPNLPILALSMHEESLYAERTLRAGAKGYIMKREATQKVVMAIRKILEGQLYLSEKMTTRLVHKLISGKLQVSTSPVDLLSDRELQVFRLIGQGRTTRQIAETLALSIKTIESHREHIKQKLTLESAAELSQRATQWVENGRSS